MIRSLYTSKSGMHANQKKLDIISNNLTNSTTMGYKKLESGFKNLYVESLDKKGIPLEQKETTIGTGVKLSESYRDNSQGMLKETLRPTDLSIDGEGYFKVIDKNGESLYTRDGAFLVDGGGQLVDTMGNKVHIEYINGRNEGNTKFKAENLLVDTEGSVFIKEGDKFNKVGRIPTYTSVGDGAFNSVGGNHFKLAKGSVEMETKNCDIYQGALEGSNVDMAEEFTDMIITQRAFQLSSKSLTTADEMWGMINNMRSK